MPRKSSKRGPATDSYSAESLYQRFRDTEHAAQALLDNLESLLEAARQYIRKKARTYELFRVQPGEGPVPVYRVAPRPTDHLIAEYVASGESEFWPRLDGPTLDFIEELMTGRRTSVVAVTGRTSASALRAVRLLSEAPIPIPEDWFNVQPLVGFLRWEVIGKHPELGSVVNLDSDWPRVEVHPALQRGFDDLAFTLACGFGRHEVPPEALLSDRHRLLARLVAQDRRVPKLVRGVRVKDLAHYLAGLVSPEDLEAVREELRLECAAVASRLPEVMAHVEALRALSESASPKGRRKRKGRDPRRAHAYDLVCNEKLPLKEGLRLFNARADQQGWDTVETIQGLRDMAAAYAADFGRPRPPSRYSK